MNIDLYDIARFFSRVDVGKQTECWFFTGRRDEFGYGLFTHNKKKIGAHRFCYTMFHGDIGKDLVIRHKCDNPSCVNPFHLESGTQLDNVIDRVLRKRTAVGAMNGRSKLTDQDVRNILIDKRSSGKVAALYGVSSSVVLNIKSGRSWSHVTGIKYLPTKR